MATVGRLLVIASWLAFLGSLILPAMTFSDGSGIPGWKAALAALAGFPPTRLPLQEVLVVITGIGNIPLALSPLGLLLRHARLYRVLAVTGLALFCITASFYAMESGFGSGYFLWAGAFLGMGLGFAALAAATRHDVGR